MSEKRTIRNLTEQGKKVYVLISSEEIGKVFLSLAEQEGFIFSDGAKPTEKHLSDFYAVNADSTISYVGIVGRIAIGCNAKEILKVDFDEYLNDGV